MHVWPEQHGSESHDCHAPTHVVGGGVGAKVGLVVGGVGVLVGAAVGGVGVTVGTGVGEKVGGAEVGERVGSLGTFENDIKLFLSLWLLCVHDSVS
jgi:hypothetical protein